MDALDIISSKDHNDIVDLLDLLSHAVGTTALTFLTPLSHGTLTADGTEQKVGELTTLGRITGYISLKNLAVSDVLRLRLYVKLLSSGTYELYDLSDYADIQVTPVIYIRTKEGQYGVKVTLEQTAGSYRTFDYAFFKE